MNAKIFIGIDPGKDGGVAVIFDDGSLQLHLTPVIAGEKRGRQYNVSEMSRIIAQYSSRDAFAVLEAQQAFPGQGVTSMFSVGRGYGLWEGILSALAIPYTTVRPNVWKRDMLRGVPGEGKARSIYAAQGLFPEADLVQKPTPTSRKRKCRDGLAEALLMAEWGRRKHSISIGGVTR